jgi:pimeloyl-ACP methyl ester carboxylesterase
MSADQTAAGPGRYIQANGIDIYYESYGSGAPLLLLHGGTGNLSMWSAHIPAFAQHFQVIAADSRGHGRTVNRADTLSYRLLAEDMRGLIEALELDKPAVCGYSDGGQVALEMAIRYPQVASAYVICAAAHRWTAAYEAWAKELGMQRQGVVDLDYVEQHHADLVGALRERQDTFQGPGYWKTYLRHISMMWLEPIHYTPDDLRQIAAPTLIVSGDRDDTFLPAELAVELYRRIPQAELGFLPGSDHDFPFTDAELFSQLTLNFLLRHRPSTEP